MTSHDLADSSEVYLEEHGVPGTSGKPAGPIALPRAVGAFASAMWIREPSRAVDLHVGFRADFTVTRAGPHFLRLQASSVFRVWLDDELIVHGPLRYASSVPEFQLQEVDLAVGPHRLCIEAHDEGIIHRTTAPVPAFVVAAI